MLLTPFHRNNLGMNNRIYVALTTLLVVARHCGASQGESTTANMVDIFASNESIPSMFHFFFAICVSLVSTVFVFVSCTEDRILREFGSKGRSIEGRIMDWATVRPLYNENDVECDAMVDYQYLEAGGYTTVIRKQIKCRQSDLYLADDSQHEFVKVCVEVDNVFSFEEAMFDRPNRQRIRLLVLDDHPNSGIPESTVRDAARTGKRVPTLALPIILLLLTAFCISLGLATLMPGYLSVVSISGASLGGAVILCTLEGALFWCCSMYKKLEASLKSEYLEGGDLLVKLDSETLGTLSTSGSMSSRVLSRNPSLSIPTTYSSKGSGP